MESVSVIMASRLGYYEGSASNREERFIRAVNSFISNSYQNKELIISSDGCHITNRLFDEYYKDYSNIKLIYGDRPENDFMGIVRQRGIDESTGDVICFFIVFYQKFLQ